MAEGHFASHVRRMRLVYQRRRECLLAALESEAGDWLTPLGDAAGLHVTVRLAGAAEGLDDGDLVERARPLGLNLSPLSGYYLGSGERGLLLGFAATPDARIAPAVGRLAALIRDRLAAG